MHYKLFEWWDALIKGDVEKYQPAPEIADLNVHQKPIFVDADGKFSANIEYLAGKI